MASAVEHSAFQTAARASTPNLLPAAADHISPQGNADCYDLNPAIARNSLRRSTAAVVPTMVLQTQTTADNATPAAPAAAGWRAALDNMDRQSMGVRHPSDRE